ncbi:hypothetical protein [Flavobacterium restrictum]|uniref:Uncharacterized protein n=1 Tax=Flavobacterium restrictum TaxID=2594428 RepID=A0A553E506_9FLAO|nr:hypothetical protein [Flavobacterium restrictum]TRX40060.1 hypothetical protein FNW21_07580 [Flavobacterium restrictum]
MKKYLFVFLFAVSYCFSQSVNDYETVLIPLKFDFTKSENQYRLSTLSKFNLNKAGFQAFYTSESLPKANNDRCSLLYYDVIKEKSFLTTKLHVVFKDCNGKIVFQSVNGMSKEKDYQLAYTEALNEAFESVYALQYKYSPVANTLIPAVPIVPAVPVIAAVAVPVIAIPTSTADSKAEITSTDLLYAQPSSNGFQLVDSTPKVVIKIYKTSVKDYYTAVKGTIQGVFITKDKQWFFEYYQDDKLISEKISVKF